MLRAMRIDKMTFAALEATFMQFLDEEKALQDIPTVRMLTQSRDTIRKRAKKIMSSLKKSISEYAGLEIIPDQSRAGGGSLPEADFPTYAVSIKPYHIKVNELEKRLRLGSPPVIGRIKEDVFLIDGRTVQDGELRALVNCIIAAFSSDVS